MVTAVERPTTPRGIDQPVMQGGANWFVLTGVSWATYVGLVDDFMDRAGPRLTFDQGTLEIMSPTLPHDHVTQLLTNIVTIVSGQLGVANVDAGSVTVRRPDMERGFEADSTFYFSNIDVIEALTSTIDLAAHPPPDLVIEVDASNSSLPKLPLFAALGIPEVWRVADVDDVYVEILVLRSGEYVRAPASRALDVLTEGVLNQLVVDRKALGSAGWFQHVLRWAHERAGQG